MPGPELNLSLSITDNPGSPLYAGYGESEHMSDVDSALKRYKIIITISDEPIGKVIVHLNKGRQFNQLELPTYKMMLTDNKTQETSTFEVTRDTFLFKEIKTKSINRISLFGMGLLKTKAFSLPTVVFEPQKEGIEKFEVSRYRHMRKDYMSYTFGKDNQKAFLVAGKIPERFFSDDNTENLFCVVDKSDGQAFIGDILYREKFLKLTPEVEVRLIKRKKIIKELEFNRKGKVNKVIYL